MDSGASKDTSDFFDPEELARLMEESEKIGKDKDKQDE
jgi:hypothetical protein